MQVINGKRVWLLADLHFGIRNNSPRWLEIQRRYFYDFFIPLVRDNIQSGDALFVLGDIYDNRHSIGLSTLKLCVDIFEELGNLFASGVWLIVGNHDIELKNSNSINSLHSLKWIPNIHIFEEPELVYMATRTIFLMPWRKNHEEEIRTVRMNSSDYLFCHADISGFSLNNFEKIKDGISLDNLEQYSKVYSGHIHHVQQTGNVRMLGCPYPLTMNDIGNDKGVWVVDIETGCETYYPNTTSPKFIKITFDECLNLTIEELHLLVDNNFVDIIYSPKWINQPNLFSKIVSEFPDIQRLNQYYSESNYLPDGLSLDVGSTGSDSFNLVSLVDVWLDNTHYDEDVRTWTQNAFRKLHKKISSNSTDINIL